jgi:hypothetical protein
VCLLLMVLIRRRFCLTDVPPVPSDSNLESDPDA